MKPDYERIACDLMFRPNLVIDDAKLVEWKVALRKNKTFTDIDNAIKKAFKNGNQKTENELGLLELYLKGIFKEVK